MPALHSLVIGPGLGRDSTLEAYLSTLLAEIAINWPKMKLILDADALFFVANSQTQQSDIPNMI